jgi:allantoinase
MRKRLTNLRIPVGGDTTASREILIVDGRIAEVIPADQGPVESDVEVVDLEGCLLLPGVMDGHVHFDDPGFTHRENFETGTRAAAAGGVTCVVDMPCTSLPPVTSGASLRAKLNVIEAKAHIDFMLWGGVSGNALRERSWRENLETMVEVGVASIKVYMLSGMDTFRDLSPPQIAEVLGEARHLGIPVGVHAEDWHIVHGLEARLRREGREDPLDYAASRPEAAEVSAAETLRRLCRKTGARVHIVHLASGRALDVIAEARAEGLPLSAETCPHYLAFTADHLKTQGALLKTAPVVKSAADRDRLWEGLRSGELEFVATDHAAGQWPQEKETGSIWTDYGGVPGVELSLPYLFSEGVGSGRLTLERLTEITASAPARFFGIAHRKGRIAPGLDADFAVLDEEEEWVVRAGDLHNLNRYTPLEGHRLRGRVRRTMVRGEEVYARSPDGSETFGEAGWGQWVRRETRVEP